MVCPDPAIPAFSPGLQFTVSVSVMNSSFTVGRLANNVHMYFHFHWVNVCQFWILYSDFRILNWQMAIAQEPNLNFCGYRLFSQTAFIL